jgi:hypothetical protein
MVSPILQQDYGNAHVDHNRKKEKDYEAKTSFQSRAGADILTDTEK